MLKKTFKCYSYLKTKTFKCNSCLRKTFENTIVVDERHFYVIVAEERHIIVVEDI